MDKVGDDQADADYPEQMPQSERKAPTERHEEEPNITVMHAQAKRERANRGSGVTRRFESESEAQGDRDGFDDDGEDKAVDDHFPNAQGSAKCQEGRKHCKLHAWPQKKLK